MASTRRNDSSAVPSNKEPPQSSDSRNNKHEQKSSSKNNNVAAAARGTLATLLLRLVSFGCSQWTLRVLDPETLGRASIQLDLIMTTVLFLSREGFRLALMTTSDSSSSKSSSSSDDGNARAIWNVAWLSIPVSTLVSMMALFWHLYSHNNSSDMDYRYAGILYCLACCIEGWAEPPVLHALRRLNVTTKASAEGLATVAKTMTTVVALQYFNLHEAWPVTAFGIAQLVYALVYATYLYTQTWSTLKGPDFSSRTSSSSSTSSILDSKTCYMTLVFTLQGSFKHFLTEGDRILLTTLAGSYDQGVYAMGSAYGGLAARVLLQPLEENARLLWSRLASSITTAQADGNKTKTSSSTAALRELEQTYTVLVKLVLYVGFVFSCLAVNYTSILLNLLAGSKWGNNVEATAVLSAFCVYTAFLAWNGCTEAFVYATLSSGVDVGRLTVVHTVIGMIFAGTAFWAVPHYGTVGLVAANCLAMCIRALYSVYYAARYFTQQQQEQDNKKTTVTSTMIRLLRTMFPSPLVMLSFLGSYLATNWSLQHLFLDKVKSLDNAPPGSKLWFTCALHHVSVGAACAIGTLTLAAQLETTFRQSARSIWKGRHQD